MRIAFGAEIRRQAGMLPVGTTAHEPLEPLWAAILAVAPQPLPPVLDGPQTPRTAAEAWNAGVEAVLAIAARSAAAITATSQRRVHEDFAVAALAELAVAGRALLIPTDTPPGSVVGEPRPNPSSGPGAASAKLELTP